MRVTLQQIRDDFGIARQTFYEMNAKSNIFQKTSRGVYDVAEDSYFKLKTYYEVRKKKIRPQGSRHSALK